MNTITICFSQASENMNTAFFLSSPLTYQSASWRLNLSSWTGTSLSMARTPNATLWSLCCAASLAAPQWGPPQSTLASTVCLLVSETKRCGQARVLPFSVSSLIAPSPPLQSPVWTGPRVWAASSRRVQMWQKGPSLTWPAAATHSVPNVTAFLPCYV